MPQCSENGFSEAIPIQNTIVPYKLLDLTQMTVNCQSCRRLDIYDKFEYYSKSYVNHVRQLQSTDTIMKYYMIIYACKWYNKKESKM